MKVDLVSPSQQTVDHAKSDLQEIKQSSKRKKVTKGKKSTAKLSKGDALDLKKKMASIHPEISVGTIPELSIFEMPPAHTAVEKKYFVDHSQLTDENSPIEFSIPESSCYLDLKNSLLYVSCKMVRSDGTSMLPGEKVTTSNIPLHSMFSQIDVTLGSTLITTSANTSL